MPKKQAVVIGGTSGIGRAIAERLLDSGFEVVITGVSGKGGDGLKPGMRAVRLDVSDLGAIDAFFATLERADVLVNCAGTNRRRGQECAAHQPLPVTPHCARAFARSALATSFLPNLPISTAPPIRSSIRHR